MYKFWKFIFIMVVLYLGKNSIYFVEGQSGSKFHCSDDWCKDNPDLTCSDKVLNCSTIGFRKILSPQVCNCCKYCFNYLKQNDPCTTNAASKDPPTHICGPLLQCELNRLEDTCSPMRRDDETNSCVTELRIYEKNVAEGTVGIAQFKPDCDAHGFYNPRQCMPGSICFCMSREGERIFGVGFPNIPMDCACARDVERLKSFGFGGTFPHCLPNGDYDELQCSVYTRRCYCRNKPEDSVAIQKMHELPCFEKDSHPIFPDTPYLRECERRRSEIHFEMLQTLLNGSSIIVSDEPSCGPDGNYELIQSFNQKWECVDPTGLQIESFEADKTSATPGDMNCFCAMTRFMSSSSTGKPKCCPNGNFYSWQCSGKSCYCVDKLGRQEMKYNEVSIDNVDDLPCYENPC